MVWAEPEDPDPEACPAEGATQDVETYTTEGPKSGVDVPGIMKLADGECCRQNKVLIFWCLLGFFLLAGTAVTTGLVMHFNKASTEDHLHGYTMLPAHEVYRPKPSFLLNNTDLLQCTKKALTYNDTEATAFQFCVPKGMKLGKCELFTRNARLRTRLAENCDIYTRGNPADMGIPHGGAEKTGLAGGLSLIMMSVVLRQLTLLLMDA